MFHRVIDLEKSMKYFAFIDNIGFDHENFMLYHFLINFRVAHSKEAIIYYRQKERLNLYIERGYTFISKNLFKKLNHLHHQINVTFQFIRIHYEVMGPSFYLIYILFLNLYSLVRYSSKWIFAGFVKIILLKIKSYRSL